MRRSILIMLLIAAGAAGLRPRKSARSATASSGWAPTTRSSSRRFDDPERAGRHLLHVALPRTGGIKGAIGLAEDPGEASIACRQVGADRRGQARAAQKPARGVQRTRLADLQVDPGDALLGRQAPRPGLSRLHRPHHRRQPAQLDQRRAARRSRSAVEERSQQHPARRRRCGHCLGAERRGVVPERQAVGRHRGRPGDRHDLAEMAGAAVDSAIDARRRASTRLRCRSI